MIDDPTTDGAQWDGATKPSSGGSSKRGPVSDTHVPKPKDAGRRPPSGAPGSSDNAPRSDEPEAGGDDGDSFATDT